MPGASAASLRIALAVVAGVASAAGDRLGCAGEAGKEEFTDRFFDALAESPPKAAAARSTETPHEGMEAAVEAEDARLATSASGLSSSSVSSSSSASASTPTEADLERIALRTNDVTVAPPLISSEACLTPR
eukprot:6213491-Pleurochrysis_carterae.AAC.3